MAFLSISEAVLAASGFLARGAFRPGARSMPELRTDPEPSTTDADETAPSLDDFVLGQPYCEAVATALKDAGYLNA